MENNVAILQNAIDSIAIGLEDYESTDYRRIISSTRNIFAGILLLFKHKLCELSPPDSDEALIKQKVLPQYDATGAVNWIGKGKKTVDVQSIKERFQSLNIEVDWTRLEKINRYRNDIEHYYSTLSTDSVQQLIADSFIIIRDFISEQVGEDPKDLLGDEYWKILVDVTEVYNKEKEKCIELIERINFFSDEISQAIISFNCKECGSGLIEPSTDASEGVESNFICRTCGYLYVYEEIAIPALTNYFAGDDYWAYTDGGEPSIIECPSCFNNSYIFHEGVCGACGFEANHECEACGCNIPSGEISESGLCGYCSYMWSKIDDE